MFIYGNEACSILFWLQYRNTVCKQKQCFYSDCSLHTERSGWLKSHNWIKFALNEAFEYLRKKHSVNDCHGQVCIAFVINLWQKLAALIKPSGWCCKINEVNAIHRPLDVMFDWAKRQKATNESRVSSVILSTLKLLEHASKGINPIFRCKNNGNTWWKSGHYSELLPPRCIGIAL